MGHLRGHDMSALYPQGQTAQDRVAQYRTAPYMTSPWWYYTGLERVMDYHSRLFLSGHCCASKFSLGRTKTIVYILFHGGQFWH